MPLALSNAGGTTFSGTVSTMPDRPFTPGDGNYARSLNQFESDAPQNLNGVVTNQGLFQDINAFLALLSNLYGTAYTSPAGTLIQLSPRVMLCMIRDACNFMLTNNLDAR